jgi:hypothetical protein
MAVDTRDKRASAVLGRTYPSPDGALDADADRRHAAGLYRFEDTPIVPPAEPLPGRRRQATVSGFGSGGIY